MNLKKLIGASAIVASGVFANGAFAATVNGTGFLTSDVIFGSGNEDGNFSGINENGVELALRAKLRFDGSGLPQNIFNFDGNDTYTFDAGASANPGNRSLFNFEYSVNSDSAGILNRSLDDLNFVLEFDIDPTAGIDYIAINPLELFTDNALGNNFTANGGGVVGGFIQLHNVAQNSQNLGFGFSSDPDLPGIYSFRLSADDGVDSYSTEINVVVTGASAVPVMGTLPLLGGGLALLGLAGRLRRNS